MGFWRHGYGNNGSIMPGTERHRTTERDTEEDVVRQTDRQTIALLIAAPSRLIQVHKYTRRGITHLQPILSLLSCFNTSMKLNLQPIKSLHAIGQLHFDQ